MHRVARFSRFSRFAPVNSATFRISWVLLVLSCFILLFHSSASTTKTSLPQTADHPHTLAASYYSFRNGLSAILMLSNQGQHPMDVGITLFSLSGQRLDLPTATLSAQEARAFNLEAQAGAAAQSFAEGKPASILYGQGYGARWSAPTG